ncbi:hypothetical protein [Victivallis sp. Marseille-Q1083]|uniref:hypothetical protein n=1 Tax=Victivallis sp. Marseille-Q1083 TaxID=2717288 RepID=UPI00158CAE73|nr:hypothetical protein [Victivallis sp. Marseille-Q1083]
MFIKWVKIILLFLISLYFCLVILVLIFVRDQYISICRHCGMLANTTTYYYFPFFPDYKWNFYKEKRESYFNTFVDLHPCPIGECEFLAIEALGRVPDTVNELLRKPRPALLWDTEHPELEPEMASFLEFYERTHPDLKEQLLRALIQGNIQEDQLEYARDLEIAWGDWKVEHHLIPQDEIDRTQAGRQLLKEWLKEKVEKEKKHQGEKEMQEAENPENALSTN